MKETVAVASWALLLLSDLGQSHLLLGKSHVQKNGANCCESERGGGGWGGGSCVGRGREELRRRWMGVERDRKQWVQVVFYGALGKKLNSKRDGERRKTAQGRKKKQAIRAEREVSKVEKERESKG